LDNVEHDPLHAFVHDSEVLAPLAEGPLDGRDVAVKDLFDVEGRVASFGHPVWRATHPPAIATSPTVDKLRRSGARIVGFTKLDQLAFSLVGNVAEGEAPHNPRHEELFCGGSSSGSASAVAGSRALLAVGTDTAGSVRVPAAVCGVHGLRPTWGRIDARGTIPLARTFDTVGLLAANARALRRGFEALDTTPRIEPDRPGSVLLARDVAAALPSAEREALHRAATTIAERVGVPLVPVDMAQLVSPEVGELFSRLQGREIWTEHGAWVSEHLGDLDEDVATRLVRCRGWAEERAQDWETDEKDRRTYRDLLVDLLGADSLVVLPVLGAPAPRRDARPEVLARFRAATLPLMAPAGLGGLPQLTWTIPAPTGSPPELTAVGLLAPPGCDTLLLELLEELADTPTTGTVSAG
jgi:amidase